MWLAIPGKPYKKVSKVAIFHDVYKAHPEREKTKLDMQREMKDHRAKRKQGTNLNS